MKVNQTRRLPLARCGAIGAALLWTASGAPSRAADPDPAAAPDQTRDSGEIWGAISKAKAGQVVRVPPGHYAQLKLNGMNFPNGVTVTSADPNHPASLAGLYITSSSGLTFSNIEVTVDPRTGFAVMLGGSSHMTFDHMNMHGAAVGDGNGIMVRNSDNIRIANSDIHDVGNGIVHSNSTQLTFAANTIHAVQTDGVHGAGSSFVTVTGNTITDFYPLAGQHPDGIQFFTQGTTGVTHDLTITNNTITRGAGKAIQGIFIGSETQVPYQNVTISGNAVIGGAYHGIAVGYSDHATVTGNLVQGYRDMDSWIMVNHSTNAVVTDNEATTYKLGEQNAGLVEKANKSLRAAAIGDETALKARRKAPEN